MRPTDHPSEMLLLGPNAWLVEEMFDQYQANPASVSAEWQQFFAAQGAAAPASTDAASTSGPNGAAPTPPPPPPTPAEATSTDNGSSPAAEVAPEENASPPPSNPAGPEQPADLAPEPEPPGRVIRGASARIVSNMEASLDVPTATSFREVPAKLLEVNRTVINGYLGRTRGGKVSFTHLIAWAAVRAIADHVPAMNSSYLEGPEGEPRVVRHDELGLGIAIDLEKSDGSRSLLVPSINDAASLSFVEFMDAFDDLIDRARSNKLSVDDFAGTTISVTNPGTIGTVQSVPRLMQGQGAILGVGTIAYPAEWQAADPRTLAELAVSKIVTISSTYDHRIIQGAESGMFLQKMHHLLVGEHDFYADVFESIGVPYESVRFLRDTMPVDREEAMLAKQVQVNTLVNMHRVRGHLIADLDPLSLRGPEMHNEIDPATYGLTIWDLDREFMPTGLTGIDEADDLGERMKLRDILGRMRDAYARTIGIDYMHIQSLDEKVWIQRKVEGHATKLTADEKWHLLSKVNDATTFEQFLNTKYPGQKRFGLEGAESAIPILDTILGDAADADLDSVFMGMAHRGRLNVLVNIVGKNHEELFRTFEVGIDETSIQGSGDVKYHLGMSGTFVSRNGSEIPVHLAANPSHLEAVDPVVVGMARAAMDQIQPPADYPVLPVLIHGDAAFAGQGVVSETLNLSAIKGYRVGGTIHLVINNQVGFTTTAESQRSTVYPTDVARMVQAPIFHVNGDDPEACFRVAKLAFEYRQAFNKDVVIDMWCYRRHGHNEGDDPSYTQPLMYRRIDEMIPVRDKYVETLVKRGDITEEEAESAMADFRSRLQQALDATRDSAPPDGLRAAEPPAAIGVLPHAHTAVSQSVIDRIYAALNTSPEGFVMHPKLARQFVRRAELYASGYADWALAEAFAFGSLLTEGTSVRLSGQDSRRGTFSHRHSTLVDYDTGEEHRPLAALLEGDTELWIYDSLLSEYAALGFEYGYSLANQDALVMWEAQFGDFVNGAQIIIDQFLVAAEDKWNQGSGLVLLLPHGMEGQGPEHSSARIERFLLSSAEDNIQVVNASTAAQYFHVLRRQMHRAVRKPLVLFTPKSLLRNRAAHSPLTELTNGEFSELLDDPAPPPRDQVRRIVFCTGKVSHEAMQARDAAGAPATVVRVEQLYPWPFDAVAATLASYPNANELIWLQEEPENMGAWNFVKGRLYEMHGDTHSIRRVSRPESGSPATGSASIHAQEQAELLERALRFA